MFSFFHSEPSVSFLFYHILFCQSNRVWGAKLSTLGYYLQRWGFSVQRPVKRAYKQDQEKIDKWLNEEFPGITERANAENAEIFFGDETNIQNTCNYMRGYAPKGQTPVVRTESQKFKINMLSVVSKRGKLRFVLYKDNMNSDKLIDFMRRLVHDGTKKVFLILDITPATKYR